MVWGKLPENLDWFSGFVHTSIVDLLGKAISFRALIRRICLTWVTFSTRLFIMLTPQKPCFPHIALTQFIRLPYTIALVIVLVVALWLPLCGLQTRAYNATLDLASR
jgi:hypothetical protein